MKGVSEQSTNPDHLKIKVRPSSDGLIIGVIFSLFGWGLMVLSFTGMVPKVLFLGINGVVIFAGLFAAVGLFAGLYSRWTDETEIVELNRSMDRLTLSKESRQGIRSKEYAISEIAKIHLKHYERRHANSYKTVYQVAFELKDGDIIDIHENFEHGDRRPHFASLLAEGLKVEMERREADISIDQMATGIKELAQKGKEGVSREDLKAMSEEMVKKLRDGNKPD